MTTKTTIDEINTITRPLFEETKIEEHELFRRMSAGTLNREQLREIALQIYHVVLHFPRFLSAVLTGIPDYTVRMPLVENLLEEHGRMKEKYVHSQTYREFLLGIGVSESRLQSSHPIIPVIAYNRAITDLCLRQPYIEGLAALGVIEEIVARVSPLIGKFTREAFGEKDPSLFHFTSHETLDISHANEIYELVAAHDNKDTRPVIEQGFRLGMYYHKRMYTDILAHVAGSISICQPAQGRARR